MITEVLVSFTACCSRYRRQPKREEDLTTRITDAGLNQCFNVASDFGPVWAPGWLSRLLTIPQPPQVIPRHCALQGMKHNDKITFSREGDQHPDIKIPGDVVIVLQEKKHERFERKGQDLVMHKTISLAEALCGFSFPIKHLDGRTLLVKCVPAAILPVGAVPLCPRGACVQLRASVFESNPTEGQEGEGGCRQQVTVAAFSGWAPVLQPEGAATGHADAPSPHQQPTGFVSLGTLTAPEQCL